MKELWKVDSTSVAADEFGSEENSTEGHFSFALSHLQRAFLRLAVALGLRFVVLLVEN
jgi:hypothetical protein